MNKLSKAQREQLIALAMGTVGLMAALWYFGVTAKQEELAATRLKTAKMTKTLVDAERVMRRSDEIGDELQTRGQILSKREEQLAPDRDTYAWVINTINPFAQSHQGITISSASQPEINEAGMFSKFPYRWATFHIKGSGYFQDAGRFFADLENSFPYFSVQNLEMAAKPAETLDSEKLTITFDLVTPVTGAPETK